MCKIGIIPTDTYKLTIGEVNTFLQHRNVHEVEMAISSAWRTINFLGALLSDKFRNLDRYLPETPKRKKDRKQKIEKLDEKLSEITNRM
jgi:Na+/phosphate symporter